MNSPATVKESTEPKQKVNGNSLAVDGAIRLNLGGRTSRIPGFKTVDIEKGSDVQTDVSELPFENKSVAEIYASHILEHFPHVRTQYVLEEWRRVLVPGGKLYVSVPDFDALVNVYKVYGGFTDYIRNLLYGDQGYPLAFHYTIFTYPVLAALCCKAGFRDVKRINTMPYKISDCSKNVDTITHKPISVNVEATV
jgi:SAM-dependent methyltransferase